MEDQQESAKLTLTEKQYDEIMDKALDFFKRNTFRFGDRTSLCKSYVSAVLEFTHANNLVIQDGTFRKKDTQS